MRRLVRWTLAVSLVAGLGMLPAAGQTAAGISRMADGKPDLSGIWQVINTAAWDLEPHPAQNGIPAGLGVVEGNEIPYQPPALAKKRENFANRATADPESKCYLPGLPRATYMPFPFQIIQTSDRMAFVYEYVHAIRHFHLDGSDHPAGPIEWWMGDSRARWDGDTLVVDVRHFTDQTWLDRAGNFHSELLHIVERYTPISRDHLNYEVTIEDPKVFTRPWKISMPIYRRLDRNMQILDYDCYTFGFDFPWAADLR